MKRDELSALKQVALDELVHEAKAEEAAEINNSGRAAQIAYLLEEEEEPLYIRPLKGGTWEETYSRGVHEVFAQGCADITIEGVDYIIREVPR